MRWLVMSIWIRSFYLDFEKKIGSPLVHPIFGGPKETHFLSIFFHFIFSY